MTIGKWYKQGYKDARDGLPCDPPYFPGNKHHRDYLDGYRDGQAETLI